MIVVTGATGNVGRALVELLVAAGEDVVGVARHAPDGGLPGGAVFRAGDLGDPGGLKEVFAGADAAFLLVAGGDPAAVVDAARSAGVRRLVLLSSQGAGTRPDAYAHAVAYEQAVRASGLAWTVLRPGGFASNAFQWAEGVRAARTVAAPFGDVALPAVHPADLAEAAAVVLRGDGHAGQVYELTGGEALTPRERVRVLADVLGEPVRFVEQSRAEAAEQLGRFMPPPVLEATLGILGAPTGHERTPAPDLARLLGRAPRTFADWAAANADAFR